MRNTDKQKSQGADHGELFKQKNSISTLTLVSFDLRLAITLSTPKSRPLSTVFMWFVLEFWTKKSAYESWFMSLKKPTEWQERLAAILANICIYGQWRSLASDVRSWNPPVRVQYFSPWWHLIIVHRHWLSIINDKTTLQMCDTYNRTGLLIIGLSSFQCVFLPIIHIRITDSKTHSISTWQLGIRAQMISTDKALINSNNPNILIQLYKSENYLTTNGQVRCYRHKFWIYRPLWF